MLVTTCADLISYVFIGFLQWDYPTPTGQESHSGDLLSSNKFITAPIQKNKFDKIITVSNQKRK